MHSLAVRLALQMWRTRSHLALQGAAPAAHADFTGWVTGHDCDWKEILGCVFSKHCFPHCRLGAAGARSPHRRGRGITAIAATGRTSWSLRTSLLFVYCAAGPAPPVRADHTGVVWHYCDCGHWKDILVVFGGSCGTGLLNDLWTYDVDTNTCDTHTLFSSFCSLPLQ